MTVRDTIAALLGPLGPVGNGALDAVTGIAVARSFERGTWLLRGGERATQCFVIVRGLVRELYVTASGDEHTRAFVPEGRVTGSLLDLLSDAPAVTWLEALEPTDVLAFPYRAFIALCDAHPDLQRFARRSAEQLYVRKAHREYEMLALSAGERYERWLRDFADLDARVSRRHVASYLGMTPEHLSRLGHRSARPAARRRRST